MKNVGAIISLIFQGKNEETLFEAHQVGADLRLQSAFRYLLKPAQRMHDFSGKSLNVKILVGGFNPSEKY